MAAHPGVDMRRPRPADVALTLAALLAVAGLGVALLSPQTPASARLSAAEVARPSLSSPPEDRPTALVIGDSYTSGSALAEMSYGCQAAATMGWVCKLAAEPGTGYISGGPANRFPVEQGSGESTSFSERIPILAGMYDPEVVILDGGRSDTFAPPPDRMKVTASTIWRARQIWPDAKIVYVRPRLLAKPDDDLGVEDDIEQQLKETSGVKDLVVVDPIAGFTDTDTKPLLSSDGEAPNPAGEKAIADALGKALATIGRPPAT